MDCRFYEREFPEIEDLVMVQVTRIEEHGAYVSLLEYDSMEGLILVSELSKRRIRSISKLVRVGQIQCCAVLRVEKGNVDLSKKKVRSDEARVFESKFANAKAVNSIMRHIATHHNLSAEDVCRAVSWPLYKHFGSAHDSLRRVASGSGDDVIRFLRDSSKDAAAFEASLLEIVKRKLTPQPVKIRGDIEVSCFNYKGVDAVKSALILGKNASTEEVVISIRLVAPPQYMISTQTFNKDAGFKAIEESMRIISAEIEAAGGKFAVKHKPQIVGEDDSIALEIDDSDVSESESGSEPADAE